MFYGFLLWYFTSRLYMQFVKVEDIYVHSKIGSTKGRIENDKFITKQYKPSNLEEH